MQFYLGAESNHAAEGKMTLRGHVMDGESVALRIELENDSGAAGESLRRNSGTAYSQTADRQHCLKMTPTMRLHEQNSFFPSSTLRLYYSIEVHHPAPPRSKLTKKLRTQVVSSFAA